VNRRKVVMAVVVALIFCVGFVWSADQDQSMDPDFLSIQTKAQDRFRDGSCDDATAYEVETTVPSLDRLKDGPCDGDQDRDRLKDGPCDGEPDRDRDRDRSKDGSCQD